MKRFPIVYVHIHIHVYSLLYCILYTCTPHVSFPVIIQVTNNIRQLLFAIEAVTGLDTGHYRSLSVSKYELEVRIFPTRS